MGIMKNATVEDSPAARLKAARLKAGFPKQSHFVKKFGLVQATYSMHETGRRQFDNTTAEEYAEMLNVPLDYLLFGSRPLEDLPDESESWLVPEAELSAGKWIDVDIPVIPPANQHMRIPHDTRYPPDMQRAYLMVGQTGGCMIPNNCLVNALTVCDSPHTLPKHALVVLKRHAERGRTYELSLREVKAVTSKAITLSLPAVHHSVDTELLEDVEIPFDNPPKTLKLVGRVISATTFFG